MQAPSFSWRSTEHAHAPSSDWFWALGIAVVAGVVAAILLHNTLFAMLLLIGGITLGMSATRPEQEHTYSISTRGVTVDERLYPFKDLLGFWIDMTDAERPLLLIDAQQPLLPHLVLPLPDDVDPDALQDFLLDYLPEEELYESPAQKLFEMFGF